MTTDWGVLQRAIEGDVVLPGSADYESGLGSVEDRRERSGPERPLRPGHLYTKSEFFRRPLPGRDDRDAGRAPHPRVGPRPVAGGRLPAGGGAPTTACPPTRPPSPTAANASWSSSWSRSAPTPHRPSAPPPATGWHARGRWYIHGDPGCIPELPRPRPAGLGARLLRNQLRPSAAGQGGVRPGRLLPLPPVSSVAARR